MNVERLSSVWDLVAEAMEVRAEERLAVIERGCRGDEALKGEVLRLIAHADRAAVERFLETDDPLAPPPARDLGHPSAIGPYRVLEQLGEGGSGVVYRARQGPPLSRDVAVKLLHAGMASPEMLARFDAERRALATLDHPAIAQVLDAGVTADGRQYTVMNLIAGEAITEYARKHALNWRQRIELIRRACEGVQHAHQQGVVHRDLKPGNILVAGDPAAPEVCVIDFGTAKLLGDNFGLTTLDGRLMGTLPYMSPEQVSGGRISDIRTDVYGMGVVLFELIEGRLPHGDGNEPLPELVSRIQSSETPEIRRVPGRAGKDLTAVCRCATAKGIDERYASIGEFAEDLARVLRDETTAARNVPAAERVLRAARKAWAPVCVVVIVLMALAALAVRATLAQRETERQRALLADTVKQINSGVLREIGALSGATGARRALATSLLQPLDELAARGLDDPDLLTAQYQVLGELGNLALEDDDLHWAMEWRERALGVIGGLAGRTKDVEVHRLWAQAIVKVGDVYLARARREGVPPEMFERDSRTARAYYDRAFEIHQRLDAAFPAHLGVKDDLCYSLARLMPFEKDSGNRDAALEMVERRLGIAKSLLEAEPDNPIRMRNVINAHQGIAGEHWQAGRAEEAVASLGEAMRIADEQCAKYPDRLDFAEMRIAVYIQAYGRSMEEGDRTRAVGYFKIVEPDVRRVVAHNPGRKDLKWIKTWMDGAAAIAEEMAR